MHFLLHYIYVYDTHAFHVCVFSFVSFQVMWNLRKHVRNYTHTPNATAILYTILFFVLFCFWYTLHVHFINRECFCSSFFFFFISLIFNVWPFAMSCLMRCCCSKFNYFFIINFNDCVSFINGLFLSLSLPVFFLCVLCSFHSIALWYIWCVWGNKQYL